MRIISSGEAAKLIDDHSHVLFSGFGSYGAPDDILDAIAQRYKQEKHPTQGRIVPVSEITSQPS